MQVITHNGHLAIAAQQLWDMGISIGAYKKWQQRGTISVLQRGYRSTPALVAYSSIPQRYKLRIIEKIGYDPEAKAKEAEKNKPSYLESLIKEDEDTKNFYLNYRIDETRVLDNKTALEYYANAIVLMAIRELRTVRIGIRHACGNPGTTRIGIWKSLVADLSTVNTAKYPHTLPLSVRRLRDKFNSFFVDGEADLHSLIHKGFCNANSRVVTDKIEELLLSISCKSNNPYAEWVHEEYIKFVKGNIDIVDVQTGELFERNDFCKNDAPIIISIATVRNYLNQPANKVLIDNVRMGYHKFGALKRPHYHRNAPMFALSKVSLDDRDLPHKMPNGQRVKAYYAYDVASGVLLGAAYSLKKDSDLFIECLRDMFRNIDYYGFGCPLEMEVENHLVRQFENDLMRASVVFPFVRYCAPTNSQEKHAEQFNKAKKYGYEKRYQDGIGRFYAKREANQTGSDRFYNEVTNQYEYRERTYSYEQIIADDRFTIKQYNEGLHRNQKQYTGKSRMQVFLENINPNLSPINRPVLLRYIGENVLTSIRRNQYVRVQYADYALPSPKVLNALKPNNYNVMAYYLPDDDGTIREVHLYQDDKFLCTAGLIEKFTTARAEWTERDSWAMTQQAKYIAAFDKMVKDGTSDLARVTTVENLPEVVEPEVVEIIEDIAKTCDNDEPANTLPPDIENYGEYYRQRAFEMA